MKEIRNSSENFGQTKVQNIPIIALYFSLCKGISVSEIPSIPLVSFPSWADSSGEAETWRNATAAAIIFQRVDDRPAIVTLPLPRNERQFFQPRTMCRISALCRPIPLCPVMRHGRIVIDAGPISIPLLRNHGGPSHYSGKSTDNIIENRWTCLEFVLPRRYTCTRYFE